MNYDNNIQFLKNGIQASTMRAKVIANNIANINTKNYKKFNVVFEENLKKNTLDLSLKKTNVRHLSGTDESDNNITIKRSNEQSMRNDGNNVDIDIEKVNQAANTLKYNALITRISAKYSEMKSVIK